MNNPKFGNFERKNGNFYFRLTAKSGQTILASEGFSSKAGCEDGIESVKKISLTDERYE